MAGRPKKTEKLEDKILTPEQIAEKEAKRAEKKAEKKELEQKTVLEIREEFSKYVNELSDEKIIELDKFTKENFKGLPTKHIIEILIQKYLKNEVSFRQMWV